MSRRQGRGSIIPWSSAGLDGIIMITEVGRPEGSRHGEGSQAGCEGPGAGGAGRAPPGPRARDGRAVPDRGILRSPRPGAGEVRDGAPRACRGRDGDGGGPGLRRVTADLLPGPAGAGRGGPAGVGAEAAGAPGRPQVDGRGDGVRRPGAPGGAGREFRGAQPARAGALRPGGPSAEYRAGAGAPEKKRRRTR
jgi:hypothetical protein